MIFFLFFKESNFPFVFHEIQFPFCFSRNPISLLFSSNLSIQTIQVGPALPAKSAIEILIKQ